MPRFRLVCRAASSCHHVTTRTGWFALVDSSVPNGFDGHPSESAVPSSSDGDCAAVSVSG